MAEAVPLITLTSRPRITNEQFCVLYLVPLIIKNTVREAAPFHPLQCQLFTIIYAGNTLL